MLNEWMDHHKHVRIIDEEEWKNYDDNDDCEGRLRWSHVLFRIDFSSASECLVLGVSLFVRNSDDD